MDGSRSHDRIVVGIDGSPGSRHAARWAIDAAAHRKETVEFVHVWTTPVAIAHMGAVILPEDHDAYAAAAQHLMEPALAELAPIAAVASVPLEVAVTEGHPTTTLLDRLDSADLLVVGSRGHAGLAGLILGSVSDQCVQHATRPVVVVPPSARVDGAGDVVVGVDGSEHSYAAVRWAVDESARRGARLVVLHAWWRPAVPPAAGALVASADDLDDERAADTTRMLHEIVDGIVGRAEQAPVGVDLVPVESRAADALIERSHGAGLVVVGNRGRGGFAGLLLGSVSRQVVHHAASAVAVIR